MVVFCDCFLGRCCLIAPVQLHPIDIEASEWRIWSQETGLCHGIVPGKYEFTAGDDSDWIKASSPSISSSSLRTISYSAPSTYILFVLFDQDLNLCCKIWFQRRKSIFGIVLLCSSLNIYGNYCHPELRTLQKLKRRFRYIWFSDVYKLTAGMR